MAASRSLGVGMTAPSRRRAFVVEASPQIEMVIDLAVENYDETSGCVLHGLVACGRQVKNCQPAMCERDSVLVVGPHAVPVRAAMGDRVSHRADEAAGVLSSAVLE